MKFNKRALILTMSTALILSSLRPLIPYAEQEIPNDNTMLNTSINAEINSSAIQGDKNNLSEVTNTSGINSNSEDNKVSNDKLTVDNASNSVNNINASTALLSRLAEQPYVTNVSVKEDSTLDNYKGSFSIDGKARIGNTVYLSYNGTSQEQVINENIDFKFSVESTVKDFTIELYSKDSYGKSSDKTIIEVKNGASTIIKNGTTPTSNTLPSIDAKDISLSLNDKFDAMNSVFAYDKEDGELTTKIEVLSNSVDTSKAGTYKVSYKITDSDGNITLKDINVTVQGKANVKPIILATDLTFDLFDKFFAIDYATAMDEEDGDLTDKIEVIENTVNTAKSGIYKVVYSVTDSAGDTTTKEIKVTVTNKLSDPNTNPILIYASPELNLGASFDPMDYVFAWDKEDGDITNLIDILENTVDTSKVGVYNVTYQIIDNDGGAAVTDMPVYVVDPNDNSGDPEPENTPPTITLTQTVVQLGDSFDPLSIVSAYDEEDGDLTDKIQVIENTVDVTKEGVYKIVYKVTDSDGATTIKGIDFTVQRSVPYISNNTTTVAPTNSNTSPIQSKESSAPVTGDPTFLGYLGLMLGSLGIIVAGKPSKKDKE